MIDSRDTHTFILDSDHRIVYWRCPPDGTLCYASEMLGEPFSALFADYEVEALDSFLHPDGWPVAPVNKVLIAKSGRRTFTRAEFRMTPGVYKGDHIWVGVIGQQVTSSEEHQAQTAPVEQPDAESLELANQQLRDTVADLKQTVNALRLSHEMNAAISEAANDAFVTIDSQGTVEAWNQRAVEMFGYPRDEALGRNLSELIVPVRLRARHQAGMDRYLRTGVASINLQRLRLPALCNDGSEIEVELTVWPTGSGEDRRFHSFLRQVSASEPLPEPVAS